MSERLVPDTFTSTYVLKGDGTINPQNTGINSYDANVDRVIGDHSSNSWGSIQQRQSRKREVLYSNPGKTGHDLGRTVENDYRVMGGKERKAAETARNLHSEALERIERWKKRKKGTAGS